MQPGSTGAHIDLTHQPQFGLGGLLVKPAELAVLKDGDRRQLQPRVMQLLVALAKASPETVSRDTLAEQCWQSRVVGDDALNRCILALRRLAREFSPEPFQIETVPRVGYRLTEGAAGKRPLSPRVAKAAVAAVAALLVIGAAVLGYPALKSALAHRGTTVLVSASGNDRTSQDLARDLTVKLATLERSHPDSMRLIPTDAGRSGNPDLTLEIASTGGTAPGADVLLKRGTHGTILWSGEFRQQSQNVDVRQQVAVKAAQVLDCTLEGLASEQRLNEQVLKAYLTGCAAVSDPAADGDRTSGILRGVVRAAPRFAAGWSKLLESESDALSETLEPAPLRPILLRDIGSARKIAPDLAAAYVAQARLTAPSDFITRSRLVDAAVARNPNSAQAHSERAGFLESVGQISDGVEDARLAVQLDPLSPKRRYTYIASLAFAGQLDAARRELTNAEELWPGTTSLVQVRYLIELRAGDPEQALRLLRSGAVRDSMLQSEFLEARADPTPRNVEATLAAGRKATSEYPEAIYAQAQALAAFGRTDELVTVLLNWNRPDLTDLITDVLFRPAFTGLHRDRRFIQVANHLGLLGYWRQTDRWPDFCFGPDLPYDCKSEAAKLSRPGPAVDG